MDKNPLQYLPDNVRVTVYVVLGLAALAVAAVQAADGDWVQAVSLFLGSLGFGTAASNTSPQAAARRRARRVRRA